MKRTTLFAEEETILELQRLARENNTSTAEIVREALAEYIVARQKPPKKLSFLGIGRSGGKKGAGRHKYALWENPHD